MLRGGSLAIAGRVNRDVLRPHGAAHQPAVHTGGQQRISNGGGARSVLGLRLCGSGCHERDDCGDSRVEANAVDHVPSVCVAGSRDCQRCVALWLDLGRRSCSVPP